MVLARYCGDRGQLSSHKGRRRASRLTLLVKLSCTQAGRFLLPVDHSREASPVPHIERPSTSPSLTPLGGDEARKEEAVAVPKRAMFTPVA